MSDGYLVADSAVCSRVHGRRGGERSPGHGSRDAAASNSRAGGCERSWACSCSSPASPWRRDWCPWPGGFGAVLAALADAGDAVLRLPRRQHADRGGHLHDLWAWRPSRSFPSCRACCLPRRWRCCSSPQTGRFVPRERAAVLRGRSGGQWTWRLAAAVCAFPLIYWTFGLMVAPFVMAYYEQGQFGLAVPSPAVILLTQFLPGACFFSLAAMPILIMWSGSRRHLILALGLAFYVLVGLFGMIQTYWLAPTLRSCTTPRSSPIRWSTPGPLPCCSSAETKRKRMSCSPASCCAWSRRPSRN